MANFVFADNLGEPEPPVNRASAIIGITLSFMITSWLFVSFRLYTRLFIVRSAGLDDIFVVLYLLSSTLGSVAVIVATHYGLGQHFLSLSPETMRNYLHTFYFANASYPMSTAFIKLSLLAQFLRIYQPGTVMRRLCIIVSGVTAIWGFVFAFMAWVPCFPIENFWNLSPDARCYGYSSQDPLQFSAIYIGHSSTNMILDIIVLAFSVPLYFTTGLAKRSKLGVIMLLLMGSIVTMLSIWRLASLIEHRSATYPTFDPTWYGPISIVLAVLEVEIASICACMPVFWPVLTRSLNRIMVTQEVKITRESRHRDGFVDDHYELGLGHGLEPVHTAESRSSKGYGQHHSRQESEVELKQTEGYTTSDLHTQRRSGPCVRTEVADYGDRSMDHRYNDDYVLASIDPLGRGFSRSNTGISAHPGSRMV